jgi:hypothetical protein
LETTASGRPLHLKRIAGQFCGVEGSFSGERDHALAAALPDLAKRLQWADGCSRAKLLGEFAARCLLRIFRLIDLALRDRPRSVVLVSPERSAGVDEQNLEAYRA